MPFEDRVFDHYESIAPWSRRWRFFLSNEELRFERRFEIWRFEDHREIFFPSINTLVISRNSARADAKSDVHNGGAFERSFRARVNRLRRVTPGGRQSFSDSIPDEYLVVFGSSGRTERNGTFGELRSQIATGLVPRIKFRGIIWRRFHSARD